MGLGLEAVLGDPHIDVLDGAEVGLGVGRPHLVSGAKAGAGAGAGARVSVRLEV